MTRTPSTWPTRSVLKLLAVACWLSSTAAGGALKFELEAGPTAFGAFRFDSILARQGDAMTVDMVGIEHTSFGPLGNLVLRCAVRPEFRCGEGRLTWEFEDATPRVFGFVRGADRITLTGDAGGRVRLDLADRNAAELSLDDVPAAWIPPPVLSRTGLAALSGRLSGTLALVRGRVRGALRIRRLAFDTPDGRFAGADLALDMDIDWHAVDERLRLDADWRSGELLLGPAYLPSPESPFTLELQLRRRDGNALLIDRLALDQAESFSLTAEGRIVPDDPPRVATLDLEIDEANLARLWRQGLNSLAGARGWGGLDPAGSLSGRLRVVNDSIVSAGLRLSDMTINDADERIAIAGLGAWLGWDRSSSALDVNADWRDARLFGIPLGPSALAFRSDESGTLDLVDSFRLPVLDGALVFERFQVRDWRDADRQLALDARLEPVDLAALTRTLGWTEFGGSLSGRFPGIRLTDGVIDVQGGMDIELFGGRARVGRLSIERPFGALPALAAGIEFQALDLEQVTGAFEFGRMLGLMSGHIRDLRLLDWQPVRFDAWLETLEDSPNREISQKAVDSISSLSGGGGAAISGTLLRWFDDFPYRKAGLGCRLTQNVCHMRGLRDTDQGGYMILEGRSIPRLDIVGYERRVDWPRLVAQLAAATGSVE